MKALSIKQPWAWLIVNGHKDIENRSWNTKFRGRFLIHASQQFDLDAMDHFADQLPPRDKLKRGGIIGSAELTDVVASSDSPWFIGPKGFLLKDAKELPFFACKGKLGFFNFYEQGELQ